MSEFTPGPWVVEIDHNGSPSAIVRENGELSTPCECPQCARDAKDGYQANRYSDLVTCDSHVYGPTLQDARLMAAAPDLVAALKLALDAAEGWVYSELHGTAQYEEALQKLEPCYAALRKATGEEQGHAG